MHMLYCYSYASFEVFTPEDWATVRDKLLAYIGRTELLNYFRIVSKLYCDQLETKILLNTEEFLFLLCLN